MATGLYIHIPFCKSKCKYCDFLSFSGCSEARVSAYVDTLAFELQTIGSELANKLIDTIFIGGGTPTYILSSQIEVIINTIYKYFKIDKNTEISIESNPGTCDTQKIREIFSLGINRLSIGLQTTEDRLLNEIGRIHNYMDFEKFYNNAISVGFENINIDLMYGLPYQTLEDINNTFNKICSFKPTHISAYSLIIEPETPFYLLNDKGLLNLPDEDTEFLMHETVKTILLSNGYNRYEISNYAKVGFECRHNLKYWNFEEYIGVGAGSHSFYNGNRIENTRDVEQYIKNFKDNQCRETVTQSEGSKEFIITGLRTVAGISISRFNKLFGDSLLNTYKTIISSHINNGLLILNEDNLYFTPLGMDLSNFVLKDFV